MPGTLYLYAQRVRIVAGRYEAVHPRKFAAHEGSSLAEHRAALVAAVSGKRGKRYLKRQQLLELGEPAIRYLTEIVHRRPRQWFEDVDRLHEILQSHGPEVLRRAMEDGLQEQSVWRVLRGAISASRVELSGGGAMKSDETGDAMGRPSGRSSFLGDPSAKFFCAERGTSKNNGKILLGRKLGDVFCFCLSSGERGCSGPQRSRARRILGAAGADPRRRRSVAKGRSARKELFSTVHDADHTEGNHDG